jgi:hypothetical protein
MMDKLIIPLATRGRPDLLRATIAQTVTNIRNPKTTIVILADDDDETMTTTEIAEHFRTYPQVQLSIAPRELGLGEKYNRVLDLYQGDVYLAMVDYAPHITPGFDNRILTAANIYPDGICVVYNDLLGTYCSQINAVTHKFMELNDGKIYPIWYPYGFVDMEIADLVMMTGRVSYADVVIERKARPGTQNRRDYAFWIKFFGLTTCVREAAAQNIIWECNQPLWQKCALIQNFPLTRGRTNSVIQMTITNQALRDVDKIQFEGDGTQIKDTERHRLMRERAIVFLDQLADEGQIKRLPPEVDPLPEFLKEVVQEQPQQEQEQDIPWSAFVGKTLLNIPD